MATAVEPADASAADVPPSRPLGFKETLTVLGRPERRLFGEYSGIPSEEVIPHVVAIRDQAWNIFPYPCIGGFRFLSISVPQNPHYDEILTRLKTATNPPATYLDLGCCFGQEIRQLVLDGVPSQNLYGSDLRREFINLGYDLFRDRETLKATFVVADVFDESEGNELAKLYGNMDIVHTGSFFHLFPREQQKAVAKRVVRLLKPEKGSLLFGRQVGNVVPGDYERRDGQGSRFHHDPASWKKFWEEIGEETGTEWEVEAKLEERAWRLGWLDTEAPQRSFSEGVKLLPFTVRRG